MRIVLTTNFSPWSDYSGGGQRSTHQLATALSRRGHEVYVVYTKAKAEKIFVPSDLNYRVVWARFFGRRSTRQAPLRSFNALSVKAEVENLMQTIGVDVVHCQGEEGALIPQLRKAFDFRLIATPRYPWYPRHLRPNATWMDRLRLWSFDSKYPMLGRLLTKADVLCPTSKSAAISVEQAYGIPSENMVVIPNGINPVFWEASWEGQDNSGYILFFGRLAKDKGVDVLLRAASRFENPIRLVGRGDELDSLNLLSRELKMHERITWIPWCTPEELAIEISKAALVVLPSRHESFGNVMAETLAVGAPLITTPAGSIPEVVGGHARLIAVDDVDALEAAVGEVLKGGSEVLEQAMAGRDFVREKFHWDEVAARFEAVYRAD